ncbi:thioredoxin family protein [bacterium]|nr:thioredoxin family protein [bacterium]
MPLLQDKDREAIIERLRVMTGEVKFIFFTQEMECQMCADTHLLLEEVSNLSDKLSMEVFDFVIDKEKAEKYNIDKVPALAMTDGSEKDYGIHYYGIPSGYEFVSLLEDILMLSSGDSGLAQDVKEAVKQLSGNVHMQVFVTPTCPYCPGAVRIAHQFAMESDHITADMVEAQEFPHLAVKYNVRGVPRTVINEDHGLEGMLPVDQVLSELQRIL